MILVLDCFSHLLSQNNKYLLIIASKVNIYSFSTPCLSIKLIHLILCLPTKDERLHCAVARVLRLVTGILVKRNDKAAPECSHNKPFHHARSGKTYYFTGKDIL